MEQRAFAGAGLAHNRHHLTGLDFEIEAVEDGERAARRLVGFDEIRDPDQGLWNIRFSAPRAQLGFPRRASGLR